MNLYGYVGNNPINAVDPLGFCGDDRLWYDRWGDWVAGKGEVAKDYWTDHLPWQAAGAVNTGIDVVTGVAQTPQALGHLGEATGEFAANPSWETASGAAGDVALFVGTAAGAAGAMSATRAGVGRGMRNPVVKAAVNRGNAMHRAFSAEMEAQGMIVDRAIPGTRLRPDAMDYASRIAHELKPGTPTGVKAAARARAAYQRALDNAFPGQGWEVKTWHY